jgi:amidase
MLDAKPWLVEPPLLEMPWNNALAKGEGLPQKLSIAILWDDGVVAPHPPIISALKTYKDALVAAGHDVIDWQPLNHKEGWELIVSLLCTKSKCRTLTGLRLQVKLYLLDGGAEYHKTMQKSGEPAVQQTAWILDHAQGRGDYTVAEIFSLNLDRETFRAKALMHWNATQQRTTTGRPVDAILCPVAPTLAPPHDTTSWWGYSSHWNVLDLPAVVFPVKNYNAGEGRMPEPRNDIERSIFAQWQPGTYANAPVSLQLVGRRHNEEKLLAMLDVVEKVVGDENVDLKGGGQCLL